MNREIKFRAFHEGKMYHSDSQEDAKLLGAKLGESIIGNFMSRFEFDDTLGQFTGLTDNQLNEIYEGDILRIVSNDYHFFGQQGVVKWDADSPGYLVVGPESVNVNYEVLDKELALQCEVIGNIHQNPELL